MAARFPQPVKVGFLVGLPVHDSDDRTIGYVRDVVRTPEGKVKLIVPYGKYFGWVPYGGWFDQGRRRVAVPLEAVAIVGRWIGALDMDRDAFDAAPTWTAAAGQPIDPAQSIRIAITRR